VPEYSRQVVEKQGISAWEMVQRSTVAESDWERAQVVALYDRGEVRARCASRTVALGANWTVQMEHLSATSGDGRARSVGDEERGRPSEGSVPGRGGSDRGVQDVGVLFPEHENGNAAGGVPSGTAGSGGVGALAGRPSLPSGFESMSRLEELNALAGRLTPESLHSAASAEAPPPTAGAFTMFNPGQTVGAVEGQAQPANVGAAISSVQGTQFGPPAGTLAGPMVGTVAGTVASVPPRVPAGPATPAGGTPWYPGGWRAAYSTPSVSVGGAQYAGYAPPSSVSGTHPTGFYGFAGQTPSHLRRPWMGGTMPPPSPALQPASFAAPYTITPGARPWQGMTTVYGTPGTLEASPTAQPGNVPYQPPLASGGTQADCNVPASGQGTVGNPVGGTIPAGAAQTQMGVPSQPSGRPVATYAVPPPAAGQTQVNYGVPLAPIGQAPATFDPRLALGGTAPANYGTPYAFVPSVPGYPGGTPVSKRVEVDAVTTVEPSVGVLNCGVVAAVELPRDTSERETVNEIVISEEGPEDSESDEDRSSEVPIHDGAGLRAGRASPEVGDAAERTRERLTEVAVMKETPLPQLVGSRGPSTVVLEREYAGLLGVASVLSDELCENKPQPPEERSPAEVESTFFENVAVSLSENPEIGGSETFVCAVRGFEDRAFPGEASPALKRSLARQALYQQMSERFLSNSNAVDVPLREKTFPSGEVPATEDVEPFRDKVPELDMERARTWNLKAASSQTA
ncbi:hypothetical protein BBJ28_00020592, partial [Nothophytophthora sp. Chile5]